MVKLKLLATSILLAGATSAASQEASAETVDTDRVLVEPGMNNDWGTGDIVSAFICIKTPGVDVDDVKIDWWGSYGNFDTSSLRRQILKSGREATFRIPEGFPFYGVTVSYELNGVTREVSSEVPICNVFDVRHCPSIDNVFLNDIDEYNQCELVIRERSEAITFQSPESSDVANDSGLGPGELTDKYHSPDEFARSEITLNTSSSSMSDFIMWTNVFSGWDIQNWLVKLGFDPGPLDGIIGAKTKSAITEFYMSSKESFNGVVDERLVLDLLNAVSELHNDDHQQSRLTLEDIEHLTALDSGNYSDLDSLIHGVNIIDIDHDGRNEIFLCGAVYDSFVDHPIAVISVDQGRIVDIASDVFGGDVPTSNDCTAIHFVDLDNDYQQDVVFSDAGRDAPPWTGTAIEVALRRDGGFQRITETFENETFGIRAYSVAAGDIDHDGFGEIILSSGNDQGASKIIQFDERNIQVHRNPLVDTTAWWSVAHASNMQVTDLDGDGFDDIFIGGQWASPANRVYWSGLNSMHPSVLPDTPLGHYAGNFRCDKPVISGADVVATAISDFDSDGDKDIVNAFEHIVATCSDEGVGYDIIYGGASLQFLEQTEARDFKVRTPDFMPFLGERYYMQAINFDLNLDGMMDIIFNYWPKISNSINGATILLNQGGLNFEKFETSDIIGHDTQLGGLILPLGNTDNGADVLVLRQNSSGSFRSFSGYTGTLRFIQ